MKPRQVVLASVAAVEPLSGRCDVVGPPELVLWPGLGEARVLPLAGEDGRERLLWPAAGLVVVGVLDPEAHLLEDAETFAPAENVDPLARMGITSTFFSSTPGPGLAAKPASLVAAVEGDLPAPETRQWGQVPQADGSITQGWIDEPV